MRVPVQQDVELRAERGLEVVGIAQVLVVVGGAAPHVVVDDADTQPLAVDVRVELLGEPAQLTLADPAVVILVEVALAHRRVQARDDEPQIVDGPQAPRPVGGELDALDARVELREPPPVASHFGTYGATGSSPSLSHSRK